MECTEYSHDLIPVDREELENTIEREIRFRCKYCGQAFDKNWKPVKNVWIRECKECGQLAVMRTSSELRTFCSYECWDSYTGNVRI